MKLNVGDTELVIGKRVTLLGLTGAIAKIFATIYPEHAVIFYECGTVAAFIGQFVLANYFPITIRNQNGGAQGGRD